jgi:hypothetical protein
MCPCKIQYPGCLCKKIAGCTVSYGKPAVKYLFDWIVRLLIKICYWKIRKTTQAKCMFIADDIRTTACAHVRKEEMQQTLNGLP